MNEKAAHGKNCEYDAGNHEIKRVVKRLSLHLNRVHSLAEIESTALSMVRFRDFKVDICYIPIATFHETI